MRKKDCLKTKEGNKKSCNGWVSLNITRPTCLADPDHQVKVVG